MLRIGSETRFAGLELSAEKLHWKLVALATGIYQTIFCVYCVYCVHSVHCVIVFNQKRTVQIVRNKAQKEG